MTIVGRRTPGSAQSQVIVELSDGSAVRLLQEYLTPDKKSMTDLGGVTPDIARLPDRGQRSGRATRGGKGRHALTVSARENSAEIYKRRDQKFRLDMGRRIRIIRDKFPHGLFCAGFAEHVVIERKFKTMSVESRYRMNQERLEELKKELEYLQTVREKEVSEQIKEGSFFR